MGSERRGRGGDEMNESQFCFVNLEAFIKRVTLPHQTYHQNPHNQQTENKIKMHKNSRSRITVPTSSSSSLRPLISSLHPSTASTYALSASPALSRAATTPRMAVEVGGRVLHRLLGR